MKKVSLITDGSCLGNPGPGGWACILRFGTVKKELFGFDPHTTNNRMELMAAIQGLLALEEPPLVEEEPSSPQRGSVDGIGCAECSSQDELDLDQGSRQPRGQ